MSIVEGLDWAIDLLPKLFGALNSWMIAPGVSVLSFSVAVILLVIIIGAIVLRV